jgi:hypothetical protein
VNLKRVAGHRLTTMALAIILCSSSVLLLSSLANTGIADAQKGVTGASKASSGNQSKNGTSAVETYIVTLKDQNSSADLQEIVDSVKQKGGNVTHLYTHSINGFSVRIPADKKTEIVYSLVSDMRVASAQIPITVAAAKADDDDDDRNDDDEDSTHHLTLSEKIPTRYLIRK